VGARVTLNPPGCATVHLAAFPEGAWSNGSYLRQQPLQWVAVFRTSGGCVNSLIVASRAARGCNPVCTPVGEGVLDRPRKLKNCRQRGGYNDGIEGKVKL